METLVETWGVGMTSGGVRVKVMRVTSTIITLFHDWAASSFDLNKGHTRSKLRSL